MRAEAPYRVETTVLFRRRREGLEQMLRVSLHPPLGAGPLRLLLHTSSWRRSVSPKGSEPVASFQLAVPPVEAPLPCECHLTVGERSYRQRVLLQPRRRWVLHVQNFTHTDIGYTDLPSRVARGYGRALKNILRFCDQTAELPPESRYRWNVETGYWLENALRDLDTGELGKLRRLVRAGRIELTPLYVAHTSEFNDEETLIRSLYYAWQAGQRLGARIRTAMASDSTGQPWMFPQLLSQSGIRFLSTSVNATMAKALRLPRPFYWQSRDGSRILVLDTDERQAYQEGVMVGLSENVSVMEKKLPVYLLDLEDRQAYPFDLLALRTPGYPGDNTEPNVAVSENVRRWNSRWAYPSLKVSTYTAFFEELESRYGALIPTHAGAWPDWWVLYHGATAFETGVNRRTHGELLEAERLATVQHARSPGASPYPREELRDLYRTMLLADEADWGAYSSVSEPDGLQSRGQRAEEQAFVYQAAIGAAELAGGVRKLMAGTARSRTGRAILVTNPLSWRRSEVAWASVPMKMLEGRGGVRILDSATGRKVPAQVVEVDREHNAVRVAFRAEDVPALGYRSFDLLPHREAEPPEQELEGGLENEFYRLRWEKGWPAEIWDREAARNLLDPRGRRRWGEPIYESPHTPRVVSLGNHAGLPEDLVFLQPYYRSIHDFYDYPPRGTRLDRFRAAEPGPLCVRRGRIFTDVTAETSLKMVPRVRIRLRLDNCFKRILLEYRLTKTETLEAEGLYIAFPFGAKAPAVRLSCQGGFFEPEREQLPGSSLDWYCLQKWLALEEQSHHLVWSALEAPLVQLFALNTGKWLDRLPKANGTIYSFPMNNYWWTNSPASQGGRFRFHYALTSGSGPFSPLEATRFGWGFHTPLRGTFFENGPAGGGETSFSFLEGEVPENVMIMGLKRAEDDGGAVMRLMELEGREATFELAVGCRRVRRAYLVTPVEEKITSLRTQGGGVRLTMRPYELCTLRLEFSGK
jgi:alpha-mannosidase